MFTRAAHLDQTITDLHAKFAGDEHLVAPVLDPVPDMAFRFAGRINIGRIDKIDARVDGLVEYCGGLGLVAAPAEVICA